MWSVVSCTMLSLWRTRAQAALAMEVSSYVSRPTLKLASSRYTISKNQRMAGDRQLMLSNTMGSWAEHKKLHVIMCSTAYNLRCEDVDLDKMPTQYFKQIDVCDGLKVSPPLFQLIAVRWLRLRQKQARWALLFCLSVPLPPSGKIYRFGVGWSIRSRMHVFVSHCVNLLFFHSEIRRHAINHDGNFHHVWYCATASAY